MTSTVCAHTCATSRPKLTQLLAFKIGTPNNELKIIKYFYLSSIFDFEQVQIGKGNIKENRISSRRLAMNI